VRPAAPLFEAVLYPNPPMGRAGQAVLILAVALVSASLGAAFAASGAWPVTGILAVDLLLLWLALRLCTRRAGRAEIITLDDAGLHVRRLGYGSGDGGWRFEPYWVRVAMDDRPRPGSRLFLTSHGRSLEVGSFLTASERLDLARTLDRVLAARR
jgi:uncharacterized membrane protein